MVYKSVRIARVSVPLNLYRRARGDDGGKTSVPGIETSHVDICRSI